MDKTTDELLRKAYDKGEDAFVKLLTDHPDFKQYIIEINISEKNVAILKDLTNLKILDCSRCTSIIDLSYLPKLLRLTCNGCTGITDLSYLTEIIILSCVDCINLTKLPLSPKLGFINCENCVKLNNNSFLHITQISQLVCNNCPNITDLTLLTKLRTILCNNYIKIKECPIRNKYAAWRTCTCIFIMIEEYGHKLLVSIQDGDI